MKVADYVEGAMINKESQTVFRLTMRYFKRIVKHTRYFQKASCLVYVCLLLVVPFYVSAADNKIDPSNPTQLNTSFNPGLDYRKVGDATVKSLIAEAQVAGPGFLLLAELGYGENSKTGKSDWRDTRVRFFHLPYENDSSDALVNAFGWSVDVFVPMSEYKNGVSGGYRIISPGIITAHNLSWGSLYPNLIYNFSEAIDDDLKNQLNNQGESTDNESIRLDFNISPKLPDPWYLMIVPAYTWGVQDASDSAYLRLFGGRFMTEKGAINLETQYNLEKRDGSLKSVDQGEKYYVRLSWYQYF